VSSGLLFTLGYRAGEASAVEPGCFNALPLAALVGYWRFGEVPTANFWQGSLLLLAGLLLVLFGPGRLGGRVLAWRRRHRVAWPNSARL
jgi:drug/metabolite transporter (DMT)-like permease